MTPGKKIPPSVTSAIVIVNKGSNKITEHSKATRRQKQHYRHRDRGETVHDMFDKLLPVLKGHTNIVQLYSEALDVIRETIIKYRQS